MSTDPSQSKFLVEKKTASDTDDPTIHQVVLNYMAGLAHVNKKD